MLELIGATALLVLFLVLQKTVRQPLMPLGIWRVPRPGSVNLAMTLLGAAWIGGLTTLLVMRTDRTVTTAGAEQVGAHSAPGEKAGV
ncbi:hypothetical protein GCM10023086_59080 [Streptomyces venetus]|uniref:Uncharacterized protein n=1 Tax=Streptomyces venetus TaxID=1701086 RepID=A0ABP8GTN2_9ACTN